MANVSNYEYLKKLMSQQGVTSIDGAILNVAGSLADVRLSGSSRALEDVQIAEHVKASAGQACSLASTAARRSCWPSSRTSRRLGGLRAPDRRDEGAGALRAATRDGYVCQWTYSGPAHHFDLFANDDPEGGSPYLVGSFTGNSTTVPYGMGCPYFAVRAVALDGAEGPLSEWVTDVTAPAAPTNFAGRYDVDGHHISWRHPFPLEALGYKIYRNTSASLEGAALVFDTLITDLSCVVPYDDVAGNYFGVVAVGYDNTGESAPLWSGLREPTAGCPDHRRGAQGKPVEHHVGAGAQHPVLHTERVGRSRRL